MIIVKIMKKVWKTNSYQTFIYTIKKFQIFKNGFIQL